MLHILKLIRSLDYSNLFKVHTILQVISVSKYSGLLLKTHLINGKCNIKMHRNLYINESVVAKFKVIVIVGGINSENFSQLYHEVHMHSY